jgi:hypothetical protein
MRLARSLVNRCDTERAIGEGMEDGHGLSYLP